ncbi:MAG: hypothetical protein ACI9S8_000939 [Chlamydiales bacterium]|jgi:hypothetical protein
MFVRHLKSFVGLSIALICSLGTLETEKPVEEAPPPKVELSISESPTTPFIDYRF